MWQLVFGLCDAQRIFPKTGRQPVGCNTCCSVSVGQNPAQCEQFDSGQWPTHIVASSKMHQQTQRSEQHHGSFSRSSIEVEPELDDEEFTRLTWFPEGLIMCYRHEELRFWISHCTAKGPAPTRANQRSPKASTHLLWHQPKT